MSGFRDLLVNSLILKELAQRGETDNLQLRRVWGGLVFGAKHNHVSCGSKLLTPCVGREWEARESFAARLGEVLGQADWLLLLCELLLIIILELLQLLPFNLLCNGCYVLCMFFCVMFLTLIVMVVMVIGRLRIASHVVVLLTVVANCQSSCGSISTGLAGLCFFSASGFGSWKFWFEGRRVNAECFGVWCWSLKP